MDHRQAGEFWNENAEAWTQLSRAGYDIYRDHLNTPAFFESLPDVRGCTCLDIGCGEGFNTRLLAQRGAHVTGVDISEIFIRHATEHERAQPLGIAYQVASAVDLPFADASFDCATAFMSFMDIPETELVLQQACRVLRRGGFLKFSICHPCFDTPHRRNLRGPDNRTYALEVGNYFDNLDGVVREWTFSSLPVELRGRFPKFQVPFFTRTLSQWINLTIEAGFQIEHLHEPYPSDETVQQVPKLQDAKVAAYFLHILARKPAR